MRAYIVAAMAVWAAAWTAAAAPPPVPPPEAYAAADNVDFIALSPSGERLAYVKVIADKRALLVTDLAGATVFAAGVGNLKVRGLDWVGEDHLLVTTSATVMYDQELANQEFSQVTSINIKTQKMIAMLANQSGLMSAVFGYYGSAEHDGHFYGYFGAITERTTTRAFSADSEHQYSDLYRVDLDSGTPYPAGQPHLEAFRHWILNDQGQVVAHSEYRDDDAQWRLYADAPRSQRLTSVRLAPADERALLPGRTPGTVVVDSQSGLEEWNVATGEHSRLPVDGDIDDYFVNQSLRTLVGVEVVGAPNTQQFFDPALAARVTVIQKALGSGARLVSFSRDYRRVIMKTENDHDSGTYWLIDGGAAKPVAYVHPGVPDEAVGPMKMFDYHAADGLALKGVLTLPPGREAKNLPLVVMPHGGPEEHDRLGFDWWAQAYAARGYAVFQPNFRGSNGGGTALRDAGFGEWGRKMQTDLSDGIAALAKAGIVDPKRSCIVGGSYGGYAALAGVTLQQGVYRCAVAVAGVSDLNRMLANYDTKRSATTRYWLEFMGAKSGGDSVLGEISPTHFANHADAPVLLIHGDNDTVVPQEQSHMMEHALRSAGKPVTFINLPGEDHWLSTAATRTAMLKASLEFVQQYNPPD